MWKKPTQSLSRWLVAMLVWGMVFPSLSYVANAASAGSPVVVWQTPIGEGTVLSKYTKSYGDKKTTLYVTKVDLNNQYVEVKPVYGTKNLLTEKQTVTTMAKEAGAVAAINADFFNMAKRGAPFGIVVKDKEIVSSMGHMDYWYSFGLTADKQAFIQKFSFVGKVTAQNGVHFSLRGMNKEEYNTSKGKSHIDQLNMYTPKFGRTSLGLIPGYIEVVEVVVENNVVKEVRVDKPGAPIPTNGYVLWGDGLAATFLLQNLPVGSTVTVESQTIPTDKEWTQAVGGHLQLVNAGKIITHYTTDSYILAPNARTAVGVSQDGKTLYMVSVDMNGESRGVTLPELATIMLELGAYQAVNFDGGGSTTMAARMLGETEAKRVNTPKGDGSERRVPTGLAVFNTAPQGRLAGFQLGGPSELLIGQTGQFTAKAYDNHYLPYKLNTSDITWATTDPEAGTFEQTKLIAKKSGTVTVTASVGDITQKRDVRVIGASDVEQVIVSPSPINLAPNQTLGLDVKIKTKRGQIVRATPLSVQATLDSEVATLKDLQLTGGDKTGKAMLRVAYDGVQTTVPINVGEFVQPWLTFDNQVGMYHIATPDTLNAKGSFTTVTDTEGKVYRSKKAAKLTYNFAGAPTSEVRIAYGRVAANPVTLPGRPFGIGLWAHGDNSSHWLRAEVLDAKGKVHYVDLAKQVDWTGWKQVKGYFPATAAYPLQLRSIYLVNKSEESSNRPEQGTLYFDEASLLQPLGSVVEPTGQDVVTSVLGKLSLGAEVDMRYDFTATSSFLEKARIDVTSIADQEMQGYTPVDYSFTIKPVALKAGKTDQLATSPIRLQFTPRKWVKGKGVGLLYVNEANQTLDVLSGQMDEQRNWNVIVNTYGTYIPYYLDISKDVPFLDVVNHPAREEILYMASQGYVKGLQPDQFGPDVPLTRAQYVTLLARVFKWELPAKPKLSFQDAIPAYAQGAVQVAMTKGLVKGYPDKTFRPDQQVTRAEAAVILDRVRNKKATPKTAIADQAAWPKWAVASINNVTGLGLMDTVGDTFAPNQPTTRAVCVVALYRTMQK